MYFDPMQIRQVVARMHRSLNEEGWLVVGAAETSQALFADFATVNFPETVFYRKTVPAAPLFPGAAVLPEEPWEAPREPRETVSSVAVMPADAPPSYEQAFDCYRHGDYAGAADRLAEAAPDVRVMLLLARIRANQGQLDQAVQWCRRALALDKLNLGAHYLMAAILEERGEPEQAIEALKRALYLEPRFVLAHFSLGNLARRLGKPNTDKHFDNVLSLLNGYAPDEVLPESEGMTAGRLAQIVQAVREVR
jgi:chemotaxis protein methyltransferase CheR